MKIITLSILDTDDLSEWGKTTMYTADSEEGFSVAEYRVMLDDTYDKLVTQFNKMADDDCILCDLDLVDVDDKMNDEATI